MNRLDYQLPNFFQMQWRSEPVQRLWEPRIKRITAAWKEIEFAKETSLQTVGVNNIGDFILRAADQGKLCYPIAQVGITDTYSSRPNPIRADGKFEYRVVICDPKTINVWKAAWSHDNRKIGELLGYPPCCVDFFVEYWVKQRFIDTTWPMIVNSIQWCGNPPQNIVSVPQFNWQNNILLRWLGIRPVSHLPCSFDCKETKRMAEANLERGIELALGEEMGWMIDLLSIPLKWTALHGVGEVTTELFRFCFNTDPTAEKYAVILQSDKKLSLPSTNSNNWTDNGFESKESQEIAHQTLLDFSFQFIEDEDSVLDLGCGNGELLRKIYDKKRIIPYGVDLSAKKITSAKERNVKGEFWACSIFDLRYWCRYYDVVFLMPGRLNEVADHSRLIASLKDFTHKIILYVYDDSDIIGYLRFFPGWKISAVGKSMLLLSQNP